MHIAQQAAAQTENQRAVPRHQFSKRLLIALTNEAFQQLPIVRRRCRGTEPMVQMP
jgi:hypothetical protein